MPSSKPTFSQMQKIKITFSLAVAGAREMLLFPWTAVTPGARILKARTARAFDLSGFEYYYYAMPNNGAQILNVVTPLYF